MTKYGSWVYRIPVHLDAVNSGSWTAMPAADTFLFGSNRHITFIDIFGITSARLLVNKQGTAGVVGSKLILRYNTVLNNIVSTWLDPGVSEISVPIDSTFEFKSSGWIDLLPEVASLDEFGLAVIGNGGNGVISPTFGSITIDLR